MRFGVLGFLVGGCWPAPPGDARAPEPLGCMDHDGDGRGAGVDCIGTDCDDSDPAVWDDAVCQSACGAGPHATGCACDPPKLPEPEPCYTGPASTTGVGACRSGLRACSDSGRWSACEGQTLPTEEVCNEIDDNCNGVTDEGVVSECGDCNFECQAECLGEGCTGFDVGEGENVVLCPGKPASCITLEPVPGTGTWSHVFQECDVGTDWISLGFTADVPIGTTLVFEVRVADDGQIEDAPWVPLGIAPYDAGPFDLSGIGSAADFGDVLELRVGFTSESESRPLLRGIEIHYFCEWGDFA